MTALLGNSGSPRWYAGDAGRLDAYLAHLIAWGATSAELVLHHGAYDERTARVHVLEPDWSTMIERYRDAGLAVQFHVSLDDRFATDRWLDDPQHLQAELRPILDLVRAVAPDQARTVLVLHGAGDPARSPAENDAATLGLSGWLAEEFERFAPGAVAAIELGARKPHRPTASARSREGTLRLVEAIGSPRVGVCWDLAHDSENASLEPGWTVVPAAAFLRRVVHVHLHDLDEEGMAHYPLVFGRVPAAEHLAALAAVGPLPPLTMEVRWRAALRLGDPWELLGESYTAVREMLAGLEVPSGG